MIKYRIKAYDRVHDVWFVQKRFLWFFWVIFIEGASGSRAQCTLICKALNKQYES